MNKIRLFYGLLSLFTIIAGMCIYLVFRDINNILIFKWFPIPEFIKPVIVKLPPSIITYVFLYNLPDMLWFVSGILLLRFIWFYKFKEQNIYIICFYLMGAVFELSQLSKNIPGTFDILDLLFMGIGAFVEGLLYNFYVTRRMI